jgi:RluA family pseudouridine synthase
MARSAAPIPILFADEHILVADKPPGLLSVATPGAHGLSLPEALERQGLRALPVHRLDREVSGAVLFALDEETRELLEAAFRARAIEKTYWALAQGHVRPPRGELKFPILEEGAWARVSARGKPSVTAYRTLRALPSTTELEIDLVTGRYNQIRLHFAHAGFPLVGERKYARGKDSPVRMRSRRVALHAWKLAFVHPRTGARVAVEAALPPDLSDLVARAERDASHRGMRDESRGAGAQARMPATKRAPKPRPTRAPWPPPKTSTRNSSRSTTRRSR